MNLRKHKKYILYNDDPLVDDLEYLAKELKSLRSNESKEILDEIKRLKRFKERFDKIYESTS